MLSPLKEKPRPPPNEPEPTTSRSMERNGQPNTKHMTTITPSKESRTRCVPTSPATRGEIGGVLTHYRWGVWIIQGCSNPHQKEGKGTLGKLRTPDNTVVNQVTWANEVIYTCAGKSATYEALNSMSFVNGYLTFMVMEPENINAKMLPHLQELMEVS